MNDMPPICFVPLIPLILFVLGLLIASPKAERDGNRKAAIWEESERKQREWLLGQPDPENPKYACRWNDGGGKRFVRDRKKYLREHPKPREIPRDSTTRPWEGR